MHETKVSPQNRMWFHKLFLTCFCRGTLFLLSLLYSLLFFIMSFIAIFIMGEGSSSWWCFWTVQFLHWLGFLYGGERNCGIMWPSYTSTIINMVSHLLPLLDPVTLIACVTVKQRVSRKWVNVETNLLIKSFTHGCISLPIFLWPLPNLNLHRAWLWQI